MMLTLKELAEYLRVNERTITRLIDKQNLPHLLVGGQYRFDSRRIDQFFFPGKTEEEQVFYEATKEEPRSILNRPYIGIPVSRVMSEDRIQLNLKATNVQELIAELTDSRMLQGYVLNIADLREKCQLRENTLSTAVGQGIAIPHPRDPIATLRTSAIITYGYSKEGIDYDAPDGKPVHHFFLTCCQNIELHLHLMGCLARLLSDTEFTTALPKCTSNAEVIKLVLQHERAEFLSRNAANAK